MKVDYDEIVRIVEDYLGPAAKRFVHRQITNHLNMRTNELTISDIPSIAEQISLSLGLLTDDKALVDSCKGRLMALKTNDRQQR